MKKIIFKIDLNICLWPVTDIQCHSYYFTHVLIFPYYYCAVIVSCSIGKVLYQLITVIIIQYLKTGLSWTLYSESCINQTSRVKGLGLWYLMPHSTIFKITSNKVPMLVIFVNLTCINWTLIYSGTQKLVPRRFHCTKIYTGQKKYNIGIQVNK